MLMKIPPSHSRSRPLTSPAGSPVPGILAIFMMGLFYKKTTNRAAIWGAIISIPFAFLFKLGKVMGALNADGKIIEGATGMQQFFGQLSQIPWMHQMGITFLVTVGLMMLISQLETKGKDDPHGIELSRELFKTGRVFNIGAFGILLILALIYSIFW